AQRRADEASRSQRHGGRASSLRGDRAPGERRPMRFASRVWLPLLNAADAELVPGRDRLAAGKVDLENLFASYGAAFLVGEPRDDLSRLDVDDVARRRIRERAVDRERHPSRLVAELHARDVAGSLLGEPRRIEDVHALVGGIGDSDLLL